jgi:hypothetical protein
MADVNSDGFSDMEAQINGSPAITAANFIL